MQSYTQLPVKLPPVPWEISATDRDLREETAPRLPPIRVRSLRRTTPAGAAALARLYAALRDVAEAAT